MNHAKQECTTESVASECGGGLHDPEHYLRELLAILHGDGGHYAAEHGLAKATEDAIAKHYARWTKVDKAIHDARKEIEYWHGDMLTPEGRAHPRGSGWARIYDQLSTALEAV